MSTNMSGHPALCNFVERPATGGGGCDGVDCWFEVFIVAWDWRYFDVLFGPEGVEDSKADVNEDLARL